MRGLRSAALLAAIASCTAGPSAQGLADAARRASATPQQTAKKYTNDDVEMAKPVTAPAAAAAPETAKGDAAKGSGEASEDAKAEAAETKKPAPYVVNRIGEVKGLIQGLQQQMRGAQASGNQADVALVEKRIANLQIELSALESRLPPPPPPAKPPS